MYKVIKEFIDLQDDNYHYNENDIFPRENKEVSDERIKELSTKNNKRGEILIEEIKEKKVTEDKKKEKNNQEKETSKDKKEKESNTKK